MTRSIEPRMAKNVCRQTWGSYLIMVCQKPFSVSQVVGSGVMARSSENS